ncbi:MAG: site-specific tyrosine recombinase XerD [Ilumatobacteraceae bacterium]
MKQPALAELPLVVEEYLTWLTVERGRSVHTIAAYRRDLVRYCGWLTARGLDLDSVRSADIVEFQRDLERSGGAPSSRARALAALRQLHRFASEEGWRADDPAADVEAVSVPAGLPKPWSEAEVGRLLDSIVGVDPIDLRDRAMCELLYATGVRVSELCGLDLADLDLESSLVRVFGKGAKERIVPFGGAAHAALERWLTPGARGALGTSARQRRDDDEAVFVGRRGRRIGRQHVWLVLRDRAERAGLDSADLSPHVLRHSCATHLLDHGADIRVVQELLGHASIATTQRYTLVSQEQLAREYRAAHPRAQRAVRR